MIAIGLLCRSEAQALLKSQCTAEEAALRLGPYSGVVVITDGANGSCICAMGSIQVIWLYDTRVLFTTLGKTKSRMPPPCSREKQAPASVGLCT